MFNYRLVFEKDDNGTILVTSPDFPLATYGNDEADAVRQATDAAECILQSMMDAREDIPKGIVKGRPQILTLPLQTKLKVALYVVMRTKGMTRADLQRSLGWQRESIDRLFRLDHNSKIERLDEAFRALGREVDVAPRELEPA